MKLFRSHDLDAVLVGEIKIAVGIDLPAQSDLQGVAFLDQSFLDGIFHRSAVGMRTAEVAAPGIAVGIKLNKRQPDQSACEWRGGWAGEWNDRRRRRLTARRRETRRPVVP